MTERYYPLRVSEVVVETEDARSLVFDVPDELAEEFRYRPGQFLTLRIPSEECDSVARCYSLSSSPHTADPLKVTVKRTPTGYGSDWILRNVRAGTVLDVLPPAGHFTPKSLERDFLFVAAGSGITPVMSIVKSALAGGGGRVTLIYANRDDRSVIFAAELAELTAKYPERFSVLHWLESLQGLPDTTGIRLLAEPFRDRDVFVCGPGPFMSGVVDALTELGIPRERTHLERFLSLSGNPFLDKPDEEPAAGEPVATVEVRMDGEKHTLPWPAGRRLLDVMLDAGLPAPYSCREGRCAACTCVKLDGSVTMAHNEVLDDQDLADGYILACQSLPDSDKLTISYE